MTNFKHRPNEVNAIQFMGGKKSLKEVKNFLKKHGVPKEDIAYRPGYVGWVGPSGSGGDIGVTEALIIAGPPSLMWYELEVGKWIILGHKEIQDHHPELVFKIVDSDKFFELYQPSK